MLKRLKTLSVVVIMLMAISAQAQMLGKMNTSRNTTKSPETAVASQSRDDVHLIDGAPAPAMSSKSEVRRVSSVTPSGYIYGTRIFSNVWSDYSRAGLYILDPEQPKSSSIYEGGMFNTSRGVCLVDEELLWLAHVEFGIGSAGETDYSPYTTSTRVTEYVFNIATGQVVRTFYPGYPSATGSGMVYDRYTGNLYGCFENSTFNGNVFGILNIETGIRMPIALLDVSLTAMVIDNNHRMWAMDRKTGVLYEVNMTTGSLRKVGNTGLTDSYVNSGCYDALTDTYYYNVCHLGDAALYAINTETAEATLVYEFPTGDEWSSMWMYPRVSLEVPGMPADANVVFDGLDGFVRFTVPRMMANGEQGTGSVNYTIYVDGESTVTGQAAYGASVEEFLSVSHGGDAVVAIALSNDQGEGRVLRVNATAGDAAVPAPASVALTRSGSNFCVTWNKVNLSGVTYDVTRYPDETVVASGLTDTIFVEPAPSSLRETYYYGVVARLGNAQSKFVRSNNLSYGQFTLPYVNKFETRDRFDELTFINANNDAYVWTYAVNLDIVHNIHGMYLPKNSRELTWYEKLMGTVPESDDWAITPGIAFEAGKAYILKYITWGTYADYEDYRERFEVKMGTSPTVAGMTTELLGPTTISNPARNPLVKTIIFTVPSDGVYYIGYHGISQGGLLLAVQDIEISEGMPIDAPYFPKELIVTPNAEGQLKATVTVGVSRWNTQRKNIGAIGRYELIVDGRVLHTWENPTPGGEVSAEVDLPHSGTFEFLIQPYSVDGYKGIPLSTSAFVGTYQPANVASATIAETNTPGEVNVAWSAVSTDVNGNAIDANKVFYTVYDADENVLGDELTVRNLTFQAMDYENDPQQFVRYYVGVTYGASHGQYTAFTPSIPLGKPFELPFYETSNNPEMRYPWLMAGDISWGVYRENEEVSAADGDGTFMAMLASEAGQVGKMTSGKIHITGTDPKLSLNYLAFEGCNNTLAVKVTCEGDTTTLANITLSSSSSSEGYVWLPLDYSLESFAGRVIQLEFTGTVVTHASVIIDGVKVSSTPDTVIRGDLDGDGQVDVTDVSLLIDLVLGKEVTLAQGAVTDLNSDGNIDVTDVSMLIDIVLGK